MILRLSQKLNTKIKACKLSAMPLDANPYADWSCHLFTTDRTQYIILTNTASLYSCVMYGRGISNDSIFIARVLDTIRDFTADDGQQFIYRKFIAPSSGSVSFAKALNRSITGSMNDHIHAAKFMLEDDMAPSDIGFRLNKTPMSALKRMNIGSTNQRPSCFHDCIVRTWFGNRLVNKRDFADSLHYERLHLRCHCLFL